jgi:Glyoxalase/Bleomycin resistance protein/Dioxygenase superfamily
MRRAIADLRMASVHVRPIAGAAPSCAPRGVGRFLSRRDDQPLSYSELSVRRRGDPSRGRIGRLQEDCAPHGLVLASDDLERDCGEFANRGVEFDRPLQDQPWGREAVVRDPDGNKLVLQQA